MRIMKKIMASILAAAVCVSTCIAYTGNVAKASGEVLTSEDFKMVGASVRFEDEATVNGIRFGIGIKESVYSGLAAGVKSNIRLLVMPTKLVTGDLEIGETYTNGAVTANAIDTAIGTKWDLKTYADGNYYVTYVYLENIDNTCYDFDVTARAYWKADEASDAVYSNAVDRSYIYVAEAALNDVAAEESTAYPNEVEGAAEGKYSPYTAAQRDALIDVPYEQTANTIWDYVDGAFVKKGTFNGDEFIYDRTIDAGKDFTAKFTYKAQAGGNRSDNRLINFGEKDANNTFEFDLERKNDTQYQVHLRRIAEGSITWLKGCDNYWLTGGKTYDFILSVKYTDTQATVVLKGREHDAFTAYTTMFSSTVDKGSLVPGNKLGYCLHSEQRGAAFEDANDRYQCVRKKASGALFDSSNAVIAEKNNQLHVSGYTTNGNEAYCSMLDMYAYDMSAYGNQYANFTLTMDVQFEKFDNASYAGFIVGYHDDYLNGAHQRIRMNATQIRSDVTKYVDLNADTMGTEAYAAYQSNLSNGIANELKVCFATPAQNGTTTMTFYVNGMCVGSYDIAASNIWQNRIALTTNTNAVFSNLVIE